MAAAEKSQRELFRNFAASATTGAITMAATNPLDCLKARWQVSPAASMWSLASKIVAEEGIVRGLWSPALALNCIACTCSMGFRVGLYPVIRDSLPGEKTAAQMLAAGSLSGCCGYFLASPLFMVKTQIQAEAGRVAGGLLVSGAKAGAKPSYRSGLHGLRSVLQLSGVRGLWNGAATFTMRGATLSSTQLMGYDLTKTTFLGRGWLEDGPVLHVTASLVASLLVCTCVMPLDVTLTRFQTGKIGIGRVYASPWQCASAMLHNEGAAVFMRGWTAMFARMGPSSVATFYLYEQIRILMGLTYLD